MFGCFKNGFFNGVGLFIVMWFLFFVFVCCLLSMNFFVLSWYDFVMV